MRVATNGCFDLFHAGHVHLLREAYNLSEFDGVYVFVNSDASTRMLKGPGRPVIPEGERCEILRACSYVRDVFLFDTENDLAKLYETIRPLYLVKDSFYRGKSITGQEHCVQVHYVDRVDVSTSDIIGRIRANP